MNDATLFDFDDDLALVARDAVANRTGPVHRGDPLTSWLAANANRVRSGGHRRRVLIYLAHRGAEGATDYETGRDCGLLRTAAGTRRHELAELGLVRKSGATRRTDMGSAAEVYELTDLGRAVVGYFRREP